MPETSQDKTIPVRVALRIRPLVPKEIGEACQECITVTPGQPQVVMGTNKAFTYDWVFSTASTQKELYENVARPLVDGFFKGYNSTVLAYGQTGSGKTYSMGTSFTICTSEDEESQGVIPRIITDLFARMEKEKDRTEYLLKVSFLEIHNEEIHDLLNPSSSDDRIAIRESCDGGIKIAGLQELKVTSISEMVTCLENGSASRVTGATAMNSRSSRSHAIYTIIMEQRDKSNKGELRTAKFHLVDLAGSERVKRTNAQGERFKEGVNINKGLLCLGNVISALSDEQRKTNAHVPYRDSKLTRLLQDSLGGNSNTLMLACVSPADSNYEETLNTLRYADRARQIKNKPIINRDPVAAEMSRLKQQVQTLQLQLLQGQTINGSLPEAMGGDNVVSMQELVDKIKDLEADNEKLSHELHDSVDQNTELYEKVLLLELTRDKMIRTFEEIRIRTGEEIVDQYYQGYSKKHKASDLRVSERGSGRESGSSDITDNADTSNGDLAAQLQSKLHELEKTMHSSPAVEHQANQGVADQESCHDCESMDTSNPSQPSSPNLNATLDSQHALRQAELGRQVQELSKALALKQELANKMIQNESAMNNKMIKQYEGTVRDLETEIKKLEKEKADMALALSAVKSSTSTEGNGKSRDKIKELESKIVELKKKQVEQQKLLRLKHQSDSTITRLNSEIQGMKSMRVKLMRQMKEESERFRNLKREKEKEILQLKEQGRKRQFEYSKLQTMHKKQQAVLKRKTEEASAANKRLKDALQKQKEAAEKRSNQQNLQGKQSEGLLPRMKSWLGHEVEVVASVNHAKRTLEEMIEDRKVLSRDLAALRGQQDEEDAQPPTKKMLPERGNCGDDNKEKSPELEAKIKSLEAEMKLRSIQVQELQQKILDAENVSGEKSKHRWNNIHTMAEAKAGLQALFLMAIDAKLKEIGLEKQVNASDTELKELRDESQKSSMRLSEERETMRRKHDNKLMNVQKEHEEKVRILLQQIPTEEQRESEAKLRRQVEENVKDMEDMKKKTNSLEQENVRLKQQISDMVKVLDNETPEPPEELVEEPEVDEMLSPDPQGFASYTEEQEVLSEEEDDHDEDAEDNLKDDPDWVKTPRPVRQPSNTRLSALMGKKRESEGNGCGCRGKCKRNCKCKAAGVMCELQCKCRVGKCSNRPKDPTTPLLFVSDESDVSTDSLTKSPTPPRAISDSKPDAQKRKVLEENDNQIRSPASKKPKFPSGIPTNPGRENKPSSNTKRGQFPWRTLHGTKKATTSSSVLVSDGSGKKPKRKSGMLSKRKGVKSTSSRLYMSPQRTVVRTPGSGFTPLRGVVKASSAKAKEQVVPNLPSKGEKKRKLHNPAFIPLAM